MIILLAIYLLFEIAYDHWAVDSVQWSVAYYAFQYGWVAVLSLYQMYHSEQRRAWIYLFFALVFAGLSVNELLCFDLTSGDYLETVKTNSPVYGLTILAVLLFIGGEIIMKWKRKQA